MGCALHSGFDGTIEAKRAIHAALIALGSLGDLLCESILVAPRPSGVFGKGRCQRDQVTLARRPAIIPIATMTSGDDKTKPGDR